MLTFRSRQVYSRYDICTIRHDNARRSINPLSLVFLALGLYRTIWVSTSVFSSTSRYCAANSRYFNCCTDISLPTFSRYIINHNRIIKIPCQGKAEQWGAIVGCDDINKKYWIYCMYQSSTRAPTLHQWDITDASALPLSCTIFSTQRISANSLTLSASF